jgi:hypothetical protein
MSNVRWSCLIVVCEDASTLAREPVFSLEASSINDISIPGGPVSHAEASPGDVIELQVSAWSITPTRRLKGYPAAMRSASPFHCSAYVVEGTPADNPVAVDAELPNFPFTCGSVFSAIGQQGCVYRIGGGRASRRGSSQWRGLFRPLAGTRPSGVIIFQCNHQAGNPSLEC